MLLLMWILLSSGVLASSGARLVPWPSWLGAWLADAANDTLPEDRQCAADSRLVLEHFKNHTAWAARMLDASSAGPSTGLLRGVTDSLGDFDECLGLGWPLAAAAPLEPQYCLVTMRTASFRPATGKGAATWATADHVGPFADVQAMMQGVGQHRAVVPLGRLRFGVCLPASCSPAAVTRATHRHLGTAHDEDLHWTVEVEDPRLCTRRHHVMEGSGPRMLLAGVSVFIGALVIVGTTLDLQGAADVKISSGVRMMSEFSARRQWLDLTKPTEHGMIVGLAGYKTLLSTLVVLFHHFVAQEGVSVGSNVFASTADGSTTAVLALLQDCIHNGMAHFFFVSGFLMVQAGHKDPLLAPIRRAARFLPMLALSVLVYLVFPYLGSGPAWRWRAAQEQDDCQAAWWRPLLYINNDGPRGVPPCGVQLWSMAVDLQCFAVCQLSMWAWARWHRHASKSIREDTGKSSPSSGEVRGALLALAVTAVVRVGMAVCYEWPLVLPLGHELSAHWETASTFWQPYVPTTVHLLSYVLGAVMAVFVKARHRNSDTTIISKSVAHALWPVMVVLYVARLRLTYVVWRDVPDLGPVLNAAVSTLRQAAACLMTAAHVALLDPRITELNRVHAFAGSRLAVVLCRLSPLVFFLHMLPTAYTLLSMRGPMSQAPLSQLTDATAVVVQSFLMALVFQLTVKGPIQSLFGSWALWRRQASSDAKVHVN